MRLACVFVAHEARMQWRSHAFKALLAAYLALSTAPVAILFAVREKLGVVLGAGSYADAVSWFGPPLTALLAATVGATAAVREWNEGSLATLGVCPVTNSGYLLRRFLGVAALVVPASFVPPATGALLAWLAGVPSGSVELFALPWALHVLPVALASAAVGASLSVICGGPLRAVLIGLLLGWIPITLGNDLLARFGMHVEGPGEWLDLGSLGALGVVFSPSYVYFLGNSTDAPVDPGLLAEYLVSRGAVASAIAFLLLGVAALLIGRTRRDLRPWRRRPAHPLRTAIKTADDLRMALAPEPAPAAADRVLLLCGVVALGIAVSASIARAERFRERGLARYEAETSGQPEPTDPDVLPLAWEIRGSFGLDGLVEADVGAEVGNEGGQAVSHLAFSLNPDLAIVKLTASRGTAEARRIWDRLAVELEPPLAPGESRRLEFAVAGRPGSDRFPFGGSRTFAAEFGDFLKARLSSELADLSRAYTVRAVSRRRVSLEGMDLAPVPRYETWELTPAGRTTEVKGLFVPEERLFPAARIALELRGPAGVMVADSCGDVSVPADGGVLLAGECRLSPARFAVRGGGLVRLSGTGEAGSVLVLPSHARQAERHLPSLEEASSLARSAWPGVSTLADAAVVEWPPSADPERAWEFMPWWQARGFLPSSSEKLILVEESRLLAGEPLDARLLARELVARHLESRRRIAESQTLALRGFYRSVAAMKMGHGRAGGALVRRGDGSPGVLREPLLATSRWNYAAWSVKLPALISWIVDRVGESAFDAGLEAFLSDESPRPGTARELLDDIGRHAGISLERLYMDYFEGDALPVLSLEGVEFRKRDGGWEVSGRVRNLGTGETICPVVLRNEGGSTQTVVRVGPDESVPFSLRSTLVPRTLLLDPLHRCYRYSPGVKVIEEIPFQEAP